MKGRGPAWSNSLFEDNAEFGFGIRLAVDQHHDYARSLVAELVAELGEEVVGSLLHADQSTEAGVAAPAPARRGAEARSSSP